MVTTLAQAAEHRAWLVTMRLKGVLWERLYALHMDALEAREAYIRDHGCA
jgi:hypothetical protein